MIALEAFYDEVVFDETAHRHHRESPYRNCSHFPTGEDNIARRQRVAILGIFRKAEDDRIRPVADSLDREQILFLRLRYDRGLPHRQIALAMGSNENAVKQMHVRTLVKLREELASRKITSKDHL